MGIPISRRPKSLLDKATLPYSEQIKKIVPRRQWHITLLFLGQVRGYREYIDKIAQDMPQPYAPVITLTHVGQGLNRKQLWTYVHKTNILDRIRVQMERRVRQRGIELNYGKGKPKRFTPHITLAGLRPGYYQKGLADMPLLTSFTAKRAIIYRSELRADGSVYFKEASIYFSP